MDIEKFQAGVWRNINDYKYFLPEIINRSFIVSTSLISQKLEMAALRLGELNSYAKLVPDINTFIKSYTKKEAVTSSRIEGTRTNIEAAFTDKADINPELRDDWMEVNQYVLAMNFALEQLKEIPLSNRLLKATHRILLAHGRGQRKYPGNFRKSQNWIGGLTLQDAAFVPPSAEHVDELMSDLERFLHNEKIHVPKLIKIAIAHYQFETIHPFLDGNGRLGRLMITLYLVSEKILEKPLLYPSAFFEKNRNLYYDKLSLTRDKNDMVGWIAFFLDGIILTAEEASMTLMEIIDLRERITVEKVSAFGKRVVNGQRFLQYLFGKPVVSVGHVRDFLGVTAKSANNLVRLFVNAGILKEVTQRKRNRLFVFEQYLNLLKKD